MAIDRFNAYLFQHYGGRKAIRHAISTGKLVEVLLGRKPTETPRRPIPPGKPRCTPTQKARSRSRYYCNVIRDLQETNNSAEKYQRRVVTIMAERIKYQREGTDVMHRTHLWTQYHLRLRGAEVPEVQWPGTTCKGGPTESKGGQWSSQGGWNSSTPWKDEATRNTWTNDRWRN